MVARPWSSSRLSCGERLKLRCDGKAGNSFPTTQGKDPSSRARRRKRGSSGFGRDSRASSRVETGNVGQLPELQQRCEGPFGSSRCEMRLASRRLSRNGPHHPWRGEPPGFSRVGAGALDLRLGPQGPAVVVSGKASPHASYSEASRESSPVDAGA